MNRTTARLEFLTVTVAGVTRMATAASKQDAKALAAAAAIGALSAAVAP